jgi:hypothetical protein
MPLSNAQWFNKLDPLVITGSITANPDIATANTDSFTFSSQALGDEDSSRIIVVAVGVGWNGVISAIASVTVGGSGCTRQVAATGNNGTTENHRAEIWSVALASGTSGDVVVTLDNATGNNRGCLITVFRLVGDVALAPSDTGSETSTAADSPEVNYSVDVNAKNSGYIVAVTARAHAVEISSWVGATEILDERAATTYASSAYHVVTVDDGTYTVVANWSEEGYEGALVVASWHPT